MLPSPMTLPSPLNTTPPLLPSHTTAVAPRHLDTIADIPTSPPLPPKLAPLATRTPPMLFLLPLATARCHNLLSHPETWCTTVWVLMGDGDIMWTLNSDKAASAC
ncbi:hypothetical protein K439DRAFT_1612144 [Ramaria rubella]|nr:hypothetical protein K439DRAFT_1612144 [Ramaria rubella]